MHGRAHNRLDDDVRTLQERLGKLGYATAGFVSAFPASSHYGLDRGFDLFDESFLSERRPEIGGPAWCGLPGGGSGSAARRHAARAGDP